MVINDTNILVLVVLVLAFVPRYLYFVFTNKKRHPAQLFEGKYLIDFISQGLLGSAACAFGFVYSYDFFYIGIFVGWIVVGLCIACLIFILWTLFWMHGYETRYQFSKLVVPAPMSILTSLLFLITGLCTLNYILIAISVVYGFLDYVWNLRGYYLTKPKIPDYMPIPEDEE